MEMENTSHMLVFSMIFDQATPGDFMFSLPGESGVCAAFFCLGVRGFESEKFSTVFKEKCKNLSICFKETSCVNVLCQINFCICNNVDDFRPFRSF